MAWTIQSRGEQRNRSYCREGLYMLLRMEQSEFIGLGLLAVSQNSLQDIIGMELAVIAQDACQNGSIDCSLLKTLANDSGDCSGLQPTESPEVPQECLTSTDQDHPADAS